MRKTAEQYESEAEAHAAAAERVHQREHPGLPWTAGEQLALAQVYAMLALVAATVEQNDRLTDIAISLEPEE